MRLSLNRFETRNGQIRYYLNGTPRKKIFFAANEDGTVQSRSANIDTPWKYHKGSASHYQKCRKDRDALALARTAFNITQDTTFEELSQMVGDGMSVAVTETEN